MSVPIPPSATSRPRVIGVVNVTPDSFSDGGRFLAAEAAIRHALELACDGADMLDIGGESTRPGAQPVSETEEIARVLPVIEGIRAQSPILLSIDTMKPAVARAAVAAGASVWNDVAALQEQGALETAAALGCGVILMHMQGEPRTMQDDPRYGDVVAEVTAFLAERARAAVAAGIRRETIWLDPGLGFGKTADHNLALIAGLDRIAALGFPVVVGASRKRFIAALDPSAKDPADRLGGSLAAALAGVARGARAVRVHNVRETVQALKTWEAIHAS